MSLRKALTFFFVFAAALLIAAPGVDAKSSRIEKRISLAATSAGQTIDASGHARYRVRGDRQDLTIEVEARVKTGTKFTVWVTNGGNTVKARTIKITSLGEGEIELKNYDGKRLPAGVAPVSSITTVTVKDSKGNVIVSGTF